MSTNTNSVNKSEDDGMRILFNIPVYGKEVNDHTGCYHYHSEVDIIAIKLKCCNSYYACYSCHEANHTVERWKSNEFDERAILCGACGLEMPIQEYFSCGSKCPKCSASFNPRCKNHWHYYFDIPSPADEAPCDA